MNGSIAGWLLAAGNGIGTGVDMVTSNCGSKRCDVFQPFSGASPFNNATSSVAGSWTLEGASPVPLPAPFALLATGIAGLFGYRRRASAPARD